MGGGSSKADDVPLAPDRPALAEGKLRTSDVATLSVSSITRDHVSVVSVPVVPVPSVSVATTGAGFATGNAEAGAGRASLANTHTHPAASKTILFLGADPNNKLGVVDELNALKAKVFDPMSRFGNYFSISPLSPSACNVESTEVVRLVQQARPDVVHFAGHSDATGNLVFSDGATLSQDFFAHIIGSYPRITLVILNGCDTGVLATWVDSETDVTVVGTSKAISGKRAMQFTLNFYTRLSNMGVSIQRAFQLARVSVEAGAASGHYCVEHASRPSAKKRFEAPLFAQGIDVEAYAAAIIRQFGRVRGLDQLSLEGSAYDELKLVNVFVPQSVRDFSKYRPELLDMPCDVVEQLRMSGNLTEWGDVLSEDTRSRRRAYEYQPACPVLAELAARDRIVILGNPGAGKSCLLRFLLLQWAAGDCIAQLSTPLPFLIELSALFATATQIAAARCTPDAIIDYLAERGGALNVPLDRGAVVARLGSGNATVYCDALDEVFDDAARTAVAEAVALFAASYPSVRILLTSRVIGYNSAPFVAAEFSQLMLQELDDAQVAQFITYWHNVTWTSDTVERREEKKQSLLTAFSESHAVRQLASNPLLLTMMAILNRTIPQLSRNWLRLYEECSRLLLDRWKVDDAMRGDAHLRYYGDVFNVHEKAGMLRLLAWEMQSDGSRAALGNIVSEEQLARLFSEEVKPLLGNAAVSLAAMVAAVIGQLHKRNFILSFVGGRAYAFIHRSFLEYFCALAIETQWTNRQTVKESQVLVGHFHLHAQQPEWAEVLTLVCGMVPSKFLRPCLAAVLRTGNVFLAAECVKALQSRVEAEAEVEGLRAALLNLAGEWRHQGRNPADSSYRAVVQLGQLWKGETTTCAALIALALDSETETDSQSILCGGLQGCIVLRLLENFRELEAAKAYLVQMHTLCACLCVSNVADIALLVDAIVGGVLPSLSALDVSSNGFGDAGMHQMAKALCNGAVPQLTTLVVRGNSFGDAGMQALSEALRGAVPQLTTLDVSRNDISTDGAKALAAALSSVPQLTTLDVSCNRISVDGAKALAAALSNVQQLMTLNVCNNGISADGAKALRDAMPSAARIDL